MIEHNVLVANSVIYYHQNDEAAFFQWLDCISCVESYRGEVEDFYITLKRKPTKADLQELVAFFFRYGVDLTQLVRFETKSNRAWLRNPRGFWHERMFGNGS